MHQILCELFSIASSRDGLSRPFSQEETEIQPVFHPTSVPHQCLRASAGLIVVEPLSADLKPLQTLFLIMPSLCSPIITDPPQKQPPYSHPPPSNKDFAHS